MKNALRLRDFQLGASALLLAASPFGCALDSDDLSEGTQPGIEEEGSLEGPSAEDPNIEDQPAEPTLDVTAIFGRDCETGGALFRIHEVLDINGQPVEEFECAWAFDDGTTSNDCSGLHVFDTFTFHTAEVTVTETETGHYGTDDVEHPLQEPMVVELEASAPDCGLTIDYSIEATGGASFRRLILAVTDPDAPNIYDGAYFNELIPTTDSGSIPLDEPGVYEVTGSYSDEGRRFCTVESSVLVEVEACDDDGEEKPYCPEHDAEHEAH